MNKLKHVLIKNESKMFQTFDSSLFIDQSYFNNDRDQLYLIFQPICKLHNFLAFQAQSENGDLIDCQMKNLNLLIQQIKVSITDMDE